MGGMIDWDEEENTSSSDPEQDDGESFMPKTKTIEETMAMQQQKVARSRLAAPAQASASID